MKKQSASAEYLRLVGKVLADATFRSENDLSSNLAQVLGELGLRTVVDTGQGSRKRPDILAYRQVHEADLAMPAEVVVETKKPHELKGHTLPGAATGLFWADKTVPYIRENLSRIRFFVLTTLVDFFVLPITAELREGFRGELTDAAEVEALKARVRAASVVLSLATLPTDPGVGATWRTWLGDHLAPQHLAPVPLSEARNTVEVVNADQLEAFANTLARMVAGLGGNAPGVGGGLFTAVSDALPGSFEALDEATRRDLRLFTLASNPYTKAPEAERMLKGDFLRWRNEFVAASIHSIVSRLFTLKLIEDVYCVDHPAPLIGADFWVLNSGEDVSAEDLGPWVQAKIQALKDSGNPVIKHLAVFGAFFDWIWLHLDQTLFNTLFRLFVSHDFARLDHDLLGRFFEVYSQAVNRQRRQELGQYYTPLPVVRFMWSLAMRSVPEDARGEGFTVLDPAMGSGTFLKEGAPWLASAGGQFWTRMVGFDISAQVMGIAQTNVFMAVLRELAPDQAGEVSALRLFTTDSLDPRNGRFLQEIAPLFEDATHRAYLERVVQVSANIKKNEHFCLAIGNPPYRNNSSLTLGEVAKRFPRLLESSAKAARAQVRNIRDDYAWFLAAADHFVTGTGLICFVTSDSYTHKGSYRGLREELLKSYEVHALVRLGGGVFQDVSPRLGFCVIVLSKREKPLKRLGRTVSAVPYLDLGGLVGVGQDKLRGSEEDPRFAFMARVTSGEQPLSFEPHRPLKEHNYSLLPVSREDLVRAVLSDSLPVSAKSGRRIFLKKWPGIITAFDDFFRAATRSSLQDRVAGFFAVARTRGLRGPARRAKIAAWAQEHDMAEDQERLENLANQIATRSLDFDAVNIKRSNTGSIPNPARWVPPPAHQCFIYYEPSLHIERNLNEGKEQGWGSMEQWREPRSHLIAPKLVFTTSTNPRSAYKAFVLDETWFVKLHGGTSQQYNYTGLNNPLADQRLDSKPNNLSGEGEQLHTLLEEWGAGHDGLLFYVAAIYNSSLAQEFIEQSTGRDLQIRVPGTPQREVVVAIVQLARQLQWMHRALHDPDEGGIIPASALPATVDAGLWQELGLETVTTAARGYRSTKQVARPANLLSRLQAKIAEVQLTLNARITEVYGLEAEAELETFTDVV